MTDESDAPLVRHPHIKVTLTTSIISSTLIAALSAGITWGAFSTRLQIAEKELDAWRLSALQYEARNAAQDTEIAVIKSQYGEILRRLQTIENAVVDTGRRP
jgi:hypothetical protein